MRCITRITRVSLPEIEAKVLIGKLPGVNERADGLSEEIDSLN